MKLLVVAVAQRPPAWVEAGWADYAPRMPRHLPLQLVEVKPEPRSSGKPPAAMMVAEAARIRAALPAHCRRVALDEHGDAPTTRELAARLERWQAMGDDIAFLIGGPDGLDATLKAEADERLRLSSLTLPHALVRVILAEALYRAASLSAGHPYHRE